MKKMRWVIVAVVLVLLVVAAIYIVRSNQVIYEGEVKVYTQSTEEDKVIQLAAKVNSAEEAEEIAELYGITYLRYRDGYGEYETTQDYETLRQIGLENNYPDLEIIYKSFTFTK